MYSVPNDFVCLIIDSYSIVWGKYFVLDFFSVIVALSGLLSLYATTGEIS